MNPISGVPTSGHTSPPLAAAQHSPSRTSAPSSSLYPPVGNYGSKPDLQYGAVDAANKQNAIGHEAQSGSITVPSTGNVDGAPAKPKQQRRRKAASDAPPTEGKNGVESKIKRPRKPRDPDAPPPKKRVKKDDKQLTATSSIPHGEGVPSSSIYPPMPSSTSASSPTLPRAIESKDVSKGYGSPSDSFRAPTRPASSGQRYDPVRGTSVDITTADRTHSGSYTPSGLKSPARTAPSIAISSLVSPSSPSSNISPYQPRSVPSSAHGPTTNGASHSIKPSPTSYPNGLDGTANLEIAPSKKMPEPQRKLSPKTSKTKDVAPPPLPGSALPPLTNADFGKPSNRERKYEDVPNDCIVIDVPMKSNGTGGSYVNFLKEVENKYGFDVAHPRVAEHRRRMKEVAAAGAALESVPGSADEMNLDNSEGESDVEMGGQNEGSNSESTKRKRRVNERYDLEDDFIDDSEMIWQDQALASRDGYFVWSGPLVQEGEKPTIERADGTVKRGGRGGRGTGRGGTTRGDGTGRTRGTRGGGPGSRGGTTVRKPRVTKAERAKMESEKVEREKMAATAAKPTMYPGTVMS